MSFSTALALAFGSGLLTCTTLYGMWTITRIMRFKVGILRIKRSLIEDASKMGALNDPEYRHVIGCLDTYFKKPYLTSLPSFAYMSVVFKDMEAKCPITEHSELRPVLDSATKEFVRLHIATTFLECPTIIFLRAFLKMFPKWAQQSIEKDTEQSIERSFNSVECGNGSTNRSGRMSLAGGYARSVL